MKLFDMIKTGLMAGTALAVIASCADTEIASPGTITPDGGNTPTTPTTPTATVNLVPTGGCPAGTTETTLAQSGNNADAAVCVLSVDSNGDITANTTISSGSTVAITGKTTVANGATLTIGAGAVLFGSSGNDFLNIAPGGQLVAQGTATNPIVLTSRSDVAADGSAGAASIANTSGLSKASPVGLVGTSLTEDTLRGQWGGLVINGNAPINACDDGNATGGAADCVKQGEGSSGTFGGDNVADNSGTYEYVVVKYAGFKINDTDELNGIAFQGVGNGTVVNNVQVHNNDDDGIEFFGGTVNVRNAILTGNGDDSVDYTDGWVGKMQNVLVHQAASAGDNCFEFDNFETDDDRLPRSNPTISNFTLVCNGSGGMKIREGTAGIFANGIMIDGTVDIDDSSTIDRIYGDGTAGNEILALHSMIIDSSTPFETTDGDARNDGTPVDISTAFSNNNVTAGNGSSSLTDNYFPGVREAAVPVYDVTAGGTDSFFVAKDRVGAFSSTETEANNWTTGWAFGLPGSTTAASCPTGIAETGETIGGLTVCGLSGEVLSDLTLTNGVLYQLTGQVSVGRDVGAAGDKANGVAATLTIESGVTIFGNTGNDFLSIQRGSKIRSNGTAVAPVIMTSRQDVEGTAVVASDRGQWGGLVLNGRAPINACNDADAIVNGVGGNANCEKDGEGSSGAFGGALANDDSGNLFYTRVQYAGFKINDTDELNGIAFQGTGSGTEVDFIQVHNNDDDGVEFFGGTTNVKHVVLTGNGDDSMDYTDGWQGKAQFVLVDQASDAGDNGFEFDNFETDDNRLPRSNPTISNFTIISNGSGGMKIREGTAGSLFNGIMVNGTLDIDDNSTFDRLDGDDTAGNEKLEFGSLLINSSSPFSEDSDNAKSDGTPVDITEIPGITAATTDLSNTYFPGANDQGVAVTDVTSDSFFTAVDRIGAFSSTETASSNWTSGWVLDGSLD